MAVAAFACVCSGVAVDDDDDVCFVALLESRKHLTFQHTSLLVLNATSIYIGNDPHHPSGHDRFREQWQALQAIFLPEKEQETPYRHQRSIGCPIPVQNGHSYHFLQAPQKQYRISCSSTHEKVILTMKSYDPAFSLLAIHHQTTYHPKNNDFPKTKEGFKQFFFLHPASTHLALHNRCIICSSKTIKEIKNTKIKTTSLLNQNCIYIEADSLGYNVTCVNGYLLKLHPNITHWDSMKDLLAEHLCHTPITPEDVIAWW